MAYRVFEVRQRDAKRFERAMGDDTLSRQSVTVRDARQLDLDRDTFFVLVEGEERFMPRAEALLLEFARRAARADEIRARLKAEEDEVASGLGSLFGDA